MGSKVATRAKKWTGRSLPGPIASAAYALHPLKCQCLKTMMDSLNKLILSTQLVCLFLDNTALESIC